MRRLAHFRPTFCLNVFENSFECDCDIYSRSEHQHTIIVSLLVAAKEQREKNQYKKLIFVFADYFVISFHVCIRLFLVPVLSCSCIYLSVGFRTFFVILYEILLDRNFRSKSKKSNEFLVISLSCIVCFSFFFILTCSLEKIWLNWSTLVLSTGTKTTEIFDSL